MAVADDGLFLNLAGLNETGPLRKSGRERRQEQWAKHRSEALARGETPSRFQPKTQSDSLADENGHGGGVMRGRGRHRAAARGRGGRGGRGSRAPAPAETGAGPQEAASVPRAAPEAPQVLKGYSLSLAGASERDGGSFAFGFRMDEGSASEGGAGLRQNLHGAEALGRPLDGKSASASPAPQSKKTPQREMHPDVADVVALATQRDRAPRRRSKAQSAKRASAPLPSGGLASPPASPRPQQSRTLDFEADAASRRRLDPGAPAERVGRLRQAQRRRADRDLTPDQDDICAPEEEGERGMEDLSELVRTYRRRDDDLTEALGESALQGGWAEAESSDEEAYRRLGAAGKLTEADKERALEARRRRRKAERLARRAAGKEAQGTRQGAGGTFVPGSLVHVAGARATAEEEKHALAAQFGKEGGKSPAASTFRFLGSDGGDAAGEDSAAVVSPSAASAPSPLFAASAFSPTSAASAPSPPSAASAPSPNPASRTKKYPTERPYDPTDARPDPACGFGQLGVPSLLTKHMTRLGFASPTAVQRACLPPLLGGRDVLVRAPTGSGKTLGYLVPLLSDLATQAPSLARADGCVAAVLAPTRELVLQVSDVLGALLRRVHWVVGGAVHGGEDRGKEKARLRRGVNVVVASPGRLLDHLENTASFRVSKMRWLVLDEADRLLDLGFLAKIRQIVGILDERREEAVPARTTALFSATLHANLGRLAALSLREPAAVGFELRGEDVAVAPHEALDVAEAVVGDTEAKEEDQATSDAENGDASLEKFEIPVTLRQYYVETPCKLRLVVLAALLRSRLQPNSRAPPPKILVFLSNRDSVEFYHAMLTRAWATVSGTEEADDSEQEEDEEEDDDDDGRRPTPKRLGAYPRFKNVGALSSFASSATATLPAPVLKLHGSMSQAARTASFVQFMQRDQPGVLLCTDVAARGLDFPGVSSIVQLDPPGQPAEYVHRVGRAARGGAAGEALLLLLPSEKDYVARLAQQGVRVHSLRVEPLLEETLRAAGGGEAGGRGLRKKAKAVPLEKHSGAFALQNRLMQVVEQDPQLAGLGAAAFVSWIRAYATHDAAVKDIFHVKRLHLGHVAHSFALRQRPSLVAAKSQNVRKREAEATSKPAPGQQGKKLKAKR